MSLAKWKALEARVNRIEKQNRWLRLGCCSCSLALVCIFTMGQSKVWGTTVEAQRFILRSAKGETRAELSTLDGDYPRLSLRSPNGEKETQLSPLGVSVSGHRLPRDLPSAHFGNLGLYFTDTQGRMVMELGGAGPKTLSQLAPVPEITIFDEKGKPIWHAP